MERRPSRLAMPTARRGIRSQNRRLDLASVVIKVVENRRSTDMHLVAREWVLYATSSHDPPCDSSDLLAGVYAGGASIQSRYLGCRSVERWRLHDGTHLIAAGGK